MKYRLPVRTERALANGRSRTAICTFSAGTCMAPTALPHPYSKRNIHGTDRLPSRWIGSIQKCGCGQPSDEESGFEKCMECGWVGGSVAMAPPVWHGTHTMIMRHTYNPSNYMKLRLRKAGKEVPVHLMDVILRVFPLVYDTFKKHCTERKNMICYGFVINRLLEKMGFDSKKCKVKTVKTPSKVKDNYKIWSKIMSNCSLFI